MSFFMGEIAMKNIKYKNLILQDVIIDPTLTSSFGYLSLFIPIPIYSATPK